MKTTKVLIVSIISILCMTACNNKDANKDQNPFMETWESPYEIPPFERIMLNHYQEAFLKGMQEQIEEIEEIINNTETPDFKNTIAAFDASGRLLSKVSNVFFAESSANGTEENLTLRSEMVPLLTQHSNNIMMNKGLFDKVKFVKENVDQATLTPEETMLLNELYADFGRNGVMLPEAEGAKLKEINEQLSILENKFAQNLLAETSSYQLVIDNEADLSGLSSDAISAASTRAEKAEMSGKWIFGLDNPSIMPFLFSNDNATLREEIFTAYLNRCNNNNEFDNKQVLQEIITLRKSKVQILGYKDYVEFALEKRMAKTAANVYQLLDQLWTPALKRANEELADMQKLTNPNSLSSSDWRYYAEKIKAEKYNISDQELLPYFKSENVRDGIFWVINQLYGVTFKELTNVSKPHPDAEVFVCIDNDGATELGVLFIDLYARPGLKRGGAWCGTYRNASQNDEGKRVLPLTYVTCNFTPPLGNDPALLTPDEIETYFHEMGHAMHNLFKNVKYHYTARVPQDFVELPSQIMEHWAFEPEVLAYYAKHYQTGEVIPEELVNKMQAASKYGQGFATTEYLAASFLDMDYHIQPSPETLDILSFEASTLSKRGLLTQIPPRYRSTYFQHIFAGSSYSAGYYSYIWSEVLDSDAFEAFKETGDIFNKKVAESFRRNILEPGGMYPADKMYNNFRGNQPAIGALLKGRGLN